VGRSTSAGAAGRLRRATIAAALLAACAGSPAPVDPVHDGPVVLVTVSGLRADAVGAWNGRLQGDLTPHLDALAAEAEWAGRAVAPSSFELLSLASYATGLTVWSHGTLEAGRPVLDSRLRTLAEALAEEGYRSDAYVAGRWLRARRGWSQGYDGFRALRGGGRARGHLASLRDGRQLVWVHLTDIEAPYRLRGDLLQRLPPLDPAVAAALPARLSAYQLARLRDPATPPAATTRRAVETLYRLGVARADERLGGLLAALRRSGRWDETLLIVTSTHGEPLPDDPPSRLARPLIEVPLVVKLPRSLRGTGGRRPVVAAGERPAASRLWATVVDAVGGAVPPGVEPSLFVPGRGGVLSELYLGNGVNEQSMAIGDHQLLRTSRFAPDEAGYHAARAATFREAPERPGAEPPAALFSRLRTAFAATPPFSGNGDPSTALVRWREDGGVEPVTDPALEAAMAATLARRWRTFSPCERSPARERRARAAASAAAGG
jgi:hypothetical protein